MAKTDITKTVAENGVPGKIIDFDNQVTGIVIGKKGTNVGFIVGNQVYKSMQDVKDSKPIGTIEGEYAYENALSEGLPIYLGKPRIFDKSLSQQNL